MVRTRHAHLVSKRQDLYSPGRHEQFRRVFEGPARTHTNVPAGDEDGRDLQDARSVYRVWEYITGFLVQQEVVQVFN